jgi:hypothetical protein
LGNVSLILRSDFAKTKSVIRLLPLQVKPVKLRDSLYLLIPVDIVRLLGVGSESNFHLLLSEKDDSVKLVYEMKKKPETLASSQSPANGDIIDPGGTD